MIKKSTCLVCKIEWDGDGWSNGCPKCDGRMATTPPTYRERIAQSRRSKVVMAAWVAAYQAGANGLDMWRAFAEWSEVDE